MSYCLFVPLRSFSLCYLVEDLEGPISTVVCKDSTMLIQIRKITILKIESSVDIPRKIVNKNMSIKVHMKVGERRNE